MMNLIKLKSLRWKRILFLSILCLVLLTLLIIGVIHLVSNNSYQEVFPHPNPSKSITQFYSEDVLSGALEQLRELEHKYDFPNISEAALEAKLTYQYRRALENESDSTFSQWVTGLSDEYVNKYIIVKIVELENEQRALQVFNSDGKLLSDLSHLAEIAYNSFPVKIWHDEFGMPVFLMTTEYGKVTQGPTTYGIFNWKGDDLTDGNRYQHIYYGSDHIIALCNYTGNRTASGSFPAHILSGSGYVWEYETTYIDANGNVLLGPIGGLAKGSFHNGYAAIQFTGDINTSYINLEGEVFLRDRAFEIEHSVSGTTMCSNVYRTDFHMFQQLYQNIEWNDIVNLSFGYDTRVVKLDGEPAILSRDCDPMMEVEYAYLGVWQINETTIWLGDNRRAVTDDDSIEYTWAIFNPTPGYSNSATLVLQSNTGENRFFSIDSRFHELSQSYFWYERLVDWYFHPLEYEMDSRDKE